MNRRGFSAPELAMAMLLLSIGSLCVWQFTHSHTARARETSCRSNVKQLALAARSYAQDYDRLPQPSQGPFALMPYIKNEQIFICPAAPRDNFSRGRCDYWLNVSLRLDDPPGALLVSDNLPTRHSGRWLGCRLDGSCFLYPAAYWDERTNR